MVDVRRYMRYVIPGLIYAVLLTLAFFISDTEKAMAYIRSGEISKNIGFILSAFLASGALGYIFSNIYFGLHWLTDDSIIAINHKGLFASLGNRINLIDAEGRPIDRNLLTKRDAWTIWSFYWYSNVENSEKYKISSARIDNLVDITHGLGASLIGTLLSFFTWIIALPATSQNTKYINWGWIIIIVVLSINYYKALKAVERMVNSILVAAITETTQGNRRIDIYYAKN